MFEIKGDLWSLPADVICITTNGMVKKDGTCVMGRGCAYEAKTRLKGIDKRLGGLINLKGNHVHYIQDEVVNYSTYSVRRAIISFPVKHNWFEKADLDLIERSCHELMEFVNDPTFHRQGRTMSFIALPRPGCGNGGLDWKDEVKPLVSKILDDRIGVVFK